MLICNGDEVRNQELLGIVLFGCAIFYVIWKSSHRLSRVDPVPSTI
jgi:hypothetical protein